MSTSSAAEEAAPFTVLTDWLTAAVHDEGTISLPDETITLFKSGIIDDDNGIRILLKLFGSPDHTNRLRLDHGAFMNLVAILLHLPNSHYQEKLLFAFMTTIELLKDTRATQAILKSIKYVSSAAEDIDTKRRKINNKLIPKMVRVLTRGDQDASMRIMAAQFLFALIQESAEAQEIARKQPETVKIGPLIDDDEDYVVRLFTANAVRSMCMLTAEAHEFWPKISRKKENSHKDFPLSRAPDSAWVRAMVDYLSNKDVGRGFHGDSRSLVSGLLSIDTGSQIFEDRPEANILSIVADRFLFVIPGSATTPLALLELWLDAHYDCFIDEQTSQDFRPDIGDDVVVHIETKGKGYQLFRGVKSAMDIAELSFPRFHQGEAFVDKASQFLRALCPVKDLDSRSATFSSREESRSFRRLDIGIIDISSNSDAEDDILSRSSTDSIHDDANFKVTTLQRSRSRQSSRTTEAKLKEAYRNKVSEATAFKVQGAQVLGPPGELSAQRQSINPQMLMLHQTDIAVDFATYVEQNSHHCPRPSQHYHRKEDEVEGSNAKPLLPRGTSDGRRQSTVPPRHVESSSGNRGNRPISKQPVAGEFHSSNSRSPQQSAKPQRSTAKISNAHPILEHNKVLLLRSGSSDRVRSPETAAGKTSAATGMDSDAQPRKPKVLKRPSKSQPSTAHSMDWDVGEMADDTSVLPAIKKAKLKEPSARTTGAQSQLQAHVDEETKRSEDSGTRSGLKRPRVMKGGHQLTQKTSTVKHEEFEIEDEEDIETPVLALQSSKAAKRRVTKAATDKIDSQGFKTVKTVPRKPALKERRALKHSNTDTASLASTRGRRELLKSKLYNDDSKFEPDLGDPRPGEEATGVLPETVNDRTARNAIPTTKTDKKTRILSPHLRGSAVVSTEKLRNEEAGDLRPNHDLPVGLLAPAAEPANENNEVGPVHETLVTASPACLSEAAASFTEETKDAHNFVAGAERNIQHQEPGTECNREEPDEITKDSYSMAATKSQGLGASFGNKLGKIVQNRTLHETKANTIAVHMTPLSNARSFIGTVNKASCSPGKKSAQVTMIDSSKTKAAEKRRPGLRFTESTAEAVKNQSTRPTLKSTKQTADPHRQDAKVAMLISDDVARGQKDPLQKDPAVLEEAETTNWLAQNEQASKSLRSNPSRKAKLSNTLPALERCPETDGPAKERQGAQSGHKYDQSHTNEQKLELEIANATIDLTLDSDDPVPLSGKGDLGRRIQESHKDADEHSTRAAYTTRIHSKIESSINQEAAGPAPKQSTRAVEAQEYATEKTRAAKKPKSTNVVTPARSSRRDKLADVQDITPILMDTTTKKAQLVHFGKYGPQNQGMRSPDKQARKSIAGLPPPPETQKHQAYKQRHSVSAIPNPFLGAPQIRVNIPNDVDEVDFDDQGDPVEDDAGMEDAVHHSTKEDSQDAFPGVVNEEGLHMKLDDITEPDLRVKTRKLPETFPNETGRHYHQALLKKKSNDELAFQYLMGVASAPVATRQLPTEMINIGGSSSQSSRVDQNGSPRLQPQLPVDLGHLTVSEMDVSPNINNGSNGFGEEDLVTSTEESASTESVSQDSDPSFHLTHEATVPAQSDRNTRTRTQVTTAVVPSPKTVKKTGQIPLTTAMKARREPRGSIGLGSMLQEKYPQAQETLTISAFKKPTLKTAVTRTLDAASAIPMTIRKTPVKSSSAQRPALKEICENYNRPSVTGDPLPSQSTNFSSFEQHRITDSHSKSPLRPYPSSDTSRRTPVSLRTRLLEKQPGKGVKREDTILENLQRGKSSRRDAEDADRTLVEGDTEHQHRRRRLSETSSVSSDSTTPSPERGTSSRKDKKSWGTGSREGQTGLRNALLEITNNVLFRLESEERAIRLKVQDYDQGGNNLIRHFRRTNTDSFLQAGVTLFEKGTATKKELDATFDGLQARKKNVRNIDSNDHGQRAVKLRHEELEEKTKQMLDISREEAGRTEQETE